MKELYAHSANSTFGKFIAIPKQSLILNQVQDVRDMVRHLTGGVLQEQIYWFTYTTFEKRKVE